ncbi:MAG: ABC transporter ATP-binding protein [Oscillospiraceae bacterium]|nr:ABC transporter ATP-binding protein [Oscillospiraceae bacterium]
MNEDKHVLISAKSLDKTYGIGESAVHALSSVSLDIYEGELLVILGSSGSGKSTLLNMLGGVDTPDGGSIVTEKGDLCAMRDKELTAYRRNDVGFVFQSFNLIAELTVRENTAMTADVSKDPDAVEKALEIVGIQQKGDSYPTQLSGGEQQRVSIARALAKDPKLLLCDEPTGALDYETGKQILAELENLVREHGKTVIIVTHTKEVGKMADRVIRMRSGRIIEEWENEDPVTAEEIEW